MLEHATLMLRPPDSSAVRAVVEPCSGAPLGFVRPHPTGLLEKLLGGCVFEVREHQDASLLFTIRNSWIRPGLRFVYDAEDHRVGVVRGRRLENRHGVVVAARRPDAESSADLFLDADGRSLATLQSGPGGTLVAFGEGTTEEPFTRMLLLAAAL